MQKTFTTDDVTIRDVPTTPVAIMEHRGDPATLGATIQRFIAWRKAFGLHRRTASDLQCLAVPSGALRRLPTTGGPVRRDRSADRGERRANQGRRDPRRALRGAASGNT